MPTARAPKKWPASWISTSSTSPTIDATTPMFRSGAGQAGTSAPCWAPSSLRPCDLRELAGAAVGFAQLVEVARRRAVDALEHVGDERVDVEEPDPALQERRDRHLVGGVERARIGAAALTRLTRERQHPERLDVGLEELERP